ncbi:GNAT family N-acetyltransferase [Chungangia koreensis]|uniref:GNAT family N-acetyltransferase n=2 Tax=Chungangia koreensis TaxID=752657 RepID=A0ABV8X8H5_9LACT
MEIRLLHESDAASYWDLRLEALKNHPEAFGSSYEEAIRREKPVEGVKRNLANPDNFTFGAFDGKSLIGMVTLLRESAQKMQHRGNIYAMYVQHQYGGKGIGTSLMEAAIQQARSLEGLEQLNLSVVTSNDSANNLYRKLGFSVFGTEKHALKIGDLYVDEHHMVLFL